MRKTFLSITLIAVAISSSAMAQAPSVTLNLNTQVLELGEAVNAQLVCTNTGAPEAPQANTQDGLRIELLSSTPMSSSFTQIINGRRSDRQTYTYQLRVTAQKVGTYTLGPILVKAGGKTYQTNPVQITVRDTQTTDEPSGDRYMFAEITVAPTSLYVTESYNATLTFGIRKVEIGGRIYDVNMLQNVLDVQGSQLSVFADGRARRSERWLPDSSGDRHQYEVFTVPVQVRAEEPGDVQVGPVFLKAQYPTQMRRGFFGGYEVTRYRREVARTEAVTVTVKSPPLEGRPDSYTGAIGRFKFSVTAKPDRVEQGQPITLVMSITGSPLDGVLGPDLSKNPGLASRFDYTSDELVGDIEGNAKVFRRAVFPRQVGDQTIPPIEWSYFDTRGERYVVSSSEAIPIHIDPATKTAGTDVSLPVAASESHKSGLTVVTGGLSPNYMNASAVLADQSVGLSTTWLVVLAVSPALWLVVALTNLMRRRAFADPQGARRRQARRAAQSRIARALRNREPGNALRELGGALAEYFADRNGLGAGTVTPADVRLLLSTNGFDEKIATEVVDFLEACDASEYAPTTMSGVSPAEAARMVRGWIDRVEKHG